MGSEKLREIIRIYLIILYISIHLSTIFNKRRLAMKWSEKYWLDHLIVWRSQTDAENTNQPDSSWETEDSPTCSQWVRATVESLGLPILSDHFCFVSSQSKLQNSPFTKWLIWENWLLVINHFQGSLFSAVFKALSL